MTLSPDSVRRSLSRINARKAPGPDNIPGRVLRDCAVELTDVFTDIFNISLSQAVVPTCFKATTIIPVPKKSSPSCFNDYRPVALTPILMKCFEWLVMQHIKSVLPPSLDPFQFAYRSNRSTDDAIATALHPALTHLDKTDTYVRLLVIDFSSAFNTIIPQQLIHKLVQLGLNTSLCNWLLDFLTGRPQAVQVGSNTSSTITLNTGAPQGCVLSPLLFTLLTHDCTPSHNSNLFIKFADDDCGGSHQQQRWDKLQERGEPPGRVVQWQSLSECGEDEGDCRWLQESALSACSDWKTASSTRLSGSGTPSRPCPPPPLSYPTHHWTLKPSVWISFAWLYSQACGHPCCLCTFSYPNSSFQSTLHLICFDTALCKQPHLSVMTFCDLPSSWRVSMFVFWIIGKSAVFPIIVVSKNKKYPEFILYG